VKAVQNLIEFGLGQVQGERSSVAKKERVFTPMRPGLSTFGNLRIDAPITIASVPVPIRAQSV